MANVRINQQAMKQLEQEIQAKIERTVNEVAARATGKDEVTVYVELDAALRGIGVGPNAEELRELAAKIVSGTAS